MKNTGMATWTTATNYKLGAQNPQDNGTWTGNNRILLSAGESVAPGQSKTFTFSVKAPATAGTYNFQWQMLQENIAWFGDKTTNVAVTVAANRIVLSGRVDYGNGNIATYSDPNYVNPASCPAPTNVGCNDNNGVAAVWAKNPSNGDCCQYSPTCQSKDLPSSWIGFPTKEQCQKTETSCVISGNNCVQNGQSYPLTNTCINGATPYIFQCKTYTDHCEPVIRCSAGKTAVAANCSQECKNRGFADGACVALSSFNENNLNVNPYDVGQNIIGKTTDCMTDETQYYAGTHDYCGCSLPREDNVPFGQAGWFGIDSMCDALCRNAGNTMGSCLVRANNTKMECVGIPSANPIYLGTTNVCKSGANWSAGCCCARMGDPNDPANDGGGHPIARGGATNPATKLANGFSAILAQIQNEIASVSYAFSQLTASK
jgi:hypothetical protein